MWKYLIAYTSPLAAFAGFYFGGIWSFGAVYVGFVMIPLLELILPTDRRNPRERRSTAHPIFDWLLYLNVPVVFGLLTFFLYRVGSGALTGFEIFAMTWNMGVIFGTVGINVAHELGHRKPIFEQWLARILLVPCLYTHFTIEHNLGHHKHVGTPEDPATARLHESIYAFWFRSITGSWRNSWKMQLTQLAVTGKRFWSLDNHLLIGQILQLIYLIVLTWTFGPLALALAIFAAFEGIILLESVNYIEHYGLVRQKLPSGRYAPVDTTHSWNSDHVLGRIFLYELTRHSDHHYKTARKFQMLRHFDTSPQLPFGYPASIMLAIVPALWMKVMDPRVLVHTQGE